MSKIIIGIPTFENISPDTFKSIYDLKTGDNEVKFHYFRGYDCATARNGLANLALDENADYILMVDSDMTIPSEALLNLLKHKQQVVMGCYPHRNFANYYDGLVCCFKDDGEFDYTHMYTSSEIKNASKTEGHLLKIHGGGMGCVLIATDVFKLLPYPWFKYVEYDNGATLSEDLYFCDKCNHNNIPIYADSRVQCGHIFRHIQMID